MCFGQDIYMVFYTEYTWVHPVSLFLNQTGTHTEDLIIKKRGRNRCRSQFLSLSPSHSSCALIPLFHTDQALASCSIFLYVHSLWSVLFSHVSFPHLFFSVLMLLWKQNYSVYLPSLAAFPILPLSSFSPALLAVCSQYRGSPGELGRSVYGLE